LCLYGLPLSCRTSSILQKVYISSFTFHLMVAAKANPNFTPNCPKATSTPPCLCAQTRPARALPCARAPPASLRPSPSATPRWQRAPLANCSSPPQQASSPRQQSWQSRLLLLQPHGWTTQPRQPPHQHRHRPLAPAPVRRHGRPRKQLRVVRRARGAMRRQRVVGERADPCRAGTRRRLA
jgi:hypothetical protein